MKREASAVKREAGARALTRSCARALLRSAALTIGLTACQPTGDGGEGGDAGARRDFRPVHDTRTAVYNLESQPREIDPAKNTTLGGGNVIQHAFEGLMATGVNEAVVPGVAERWEVSDDGLIYDFFLRDDAKWSDGEPVTAHDFAYSWHRVFAPATASQYATLLYAIEGAEAFHSGETDDPSTLGFEALDDHHLRVRLTRPVSYFLQLMAFPISYPVRQDVVEADPDGWSNHAETYIGNGAFRMTAYERNNTIEFERNPHFWNADEVPLDRLVWLMIDDDQSELTAYLTNQMDISYGLPFPDVPMLRTDYTDHMRSLPMIGVYYVQFNNTRPPFDDVRVRQAFHMVIDRDEITREVTEGLRYPATGWVPVGILDADGETQFCEVSANLFPDPNAPETIEEAQRLLAEAGHPGGEGFPDVTFLYNTGEDHGRVAERLQSIWRNRLGIDVNLANQEWQVFIANVREFNYDMARGGWIGDYADPSTFLHIRLSYDGNNKTGYDNPEYDALLEEAMQTADTEMYFDLCHRAERLLMEEAASSPIWFYTNNFLQNPALIDVNVTPSGDTLFHQARWDIDRLRAEGVEVGG